MRNRIHSTPDIPDHKVLRKIGGGSYGEVWMARSVTDVMRAIKVVWRDDFGNARDFEREFEGIRNYEPISRNHIGLIPILHVGRSSGEEQFYYYVMELADDVESGQQFHPVEYTPRTLDYNLKKSKGTALEVDECIDLGIRVSQALGYLHSQGLAHRDIKPSNIVYHAGVPKLADIGLVAMFGQRTFVGTEGFIPPEGPGTRRADIYSLGKVLYEMSTGMDRLDFPNLPSDGASISRSKVWKQLNNVICDVCEPRVGHRSVFRAAHLVEVLEKIREGKAFRKKVSKRVILAMILTPIVIASASLIGMGLHNFVNSNFLKSSGLVKEFASVKVTSDPTGAEVWTMDGELLGTTPLAGTEAEVGSYLQYEFRMEGFSNTKTGSHVAEGGVVIEAQLPIFAPPQEGELWSDALGLPYRPMKDAHRSSYLQDWCLRQYLEAPIAQKIKYSSATITINKVKHNVVLMRRPDAQRYCEWLTKKCIEGGFLAEGYQVTPIMMSHIEFQNANQWAKGKEVSPFVCEVKKIPYSTIILQVSPSTEFYVYLDGSLVEPKKIMLGHVLKKIVPGKHSLRVEAEGYRAVTRHFSVADLKDRLLKFDLKPYRSVVFDQAWRNSLQMGMVPFSETLMVSAHETTVSAYQDFLAATSHPAPESLPFDQGPSHPVVNISREDAEAFCEWLTAEERKTFLIGEQHYYRLPTDVEWSAFCGLNEEDGYNPATRELSDNESFLWGDEWPPVDESGNFADYEAHELANLGSYRTIYNYKDGYMHTSPVGIYEMENKGIYDLSGNVYEWVSDSYGVGEYGVTRGGSWRSYQPENLHIKFRNALRPNSKNTETGFRVVLSKE